MFSVLIYVSYAQDQIILRKDITAFMNPSELAN